MRPGMPPVVVAGLPPAVLLSCALLSACQLRSPDEAEWQTSLNQALNAIALSDCDNAARLLQRSRLAAERMPTPDGSQALAATLGAQAMLAGELERPEERVQLLLEALSLREEADLSPLPILYPLSAALVETGRLDEALETHQRLLDIVQPVAEPHDPRVYQAYLVMAEAYREQGLLEQSLPFYEKASTARMYSEGSGRFDIVPGLDGYALALEALGREDDARAVREHVEWIVQGRTYADNVVIRVYGGNQFVTPVRWKRSQMPLDVFIEDPPDAWQGDPKELVETARAAVMEWSDVVEPGLPSFEFATVGMLANIQIRWVRDLGEGWIGHAKLPSFRLRNTPLRTVEVRVLAIAEGGRQPELAWVRAVVLHEIGHALGLFGHSSYSRDLMYPVLGEENRRIGERDRDTLREIYGMEIVSSPWH